MNLITPAGFSFPVSRLALGCMSLGNDRSVNEGIIHSALEAGINFFDTADLYQSGQNEVTVGRALKGHRHRVAIATKAGNRLRPDGSGWDWCADPAYIESALEASLRRLGTDYVDLFQLHGGTLEDPIDELIALFERLKASGKIRAYGISSIRPNVIRRWMAAPQLSTVMMQYGPLDPRPEEESLAYLEEKGAVLLARGVLAKGLLAGKPAAPWLGWTEEEVARYLEAFRAVFPDPVLMAAAALEYVRAMAPRSISVVGVSSEPQLQALLQAEEFCVNEKDMEGIFAIRPPFRYEAQFKV